MACKTKRGLEIGFLAVIIISFASFALAQNYGKTFDGNLGVTGKAVSSWTSELYKENSPAVVKIFVYVDYEVYLPYYEVAYNYDSNKYYAKFSEGAKNYFDSLESRFGDKFPFATNYSNMPWASGSGFLISSDGYVLTNAHVAAIADQDMEESIKDYYSQFFALSAQSLYYSGNITYEGYLWEVVLADHVYYNLEVTVTNVTYEVVVGVDDVGDGSKKYSPTLLTSEGGNWNDLGTPEFTTVKDWALLKINGNNFPYVKMGDSDSVSLGEDLIVIGYPGVTEMQQTYSANALEFRTDIIPTITRGLVSNIKQDGNDKVIQTDAAIAPGNSGGPVFDNDGKVVGIATYGTPSYQGGNYNYAVRINDLKPEIEKYTKRTATQPDSSQEANDLNQGTSVEKENSGGTAIQPDSSQEANDLNQNPFVKEDSSNKNNSAYLVIIVVGTLFVIAAIVFVAFLIFKSSMKSSNQSKLGDKKQNKSGTKKVRAGSSGWEIAKLSSFIILLC